MSIILGVTGPREVSAFTLQSLANSLNLSEQDFLIQIKLNEDTLFDALMEAEPLERMAVDRGGDENQCYENLLLIYPEAVRAETLLT